MDLKHCFLLVHMYKPLRYESMSDCALRLFLRGIIVNTLHYYSLRVRKLLPFSNGLLFVVLYYIYLPVLPTYLCDDEYFHMKYFGLTGEAKLSFLPKFWIRIKKGNQKHLSLLVLVHFWSTLGKMIQFHP